LLFTSRSIPPWKPHTTLFLAGEKQEAEHSGEEQTTRRLQKSEKSEDRLEHTNSARKVTKAWNFEIASAIAYSVK